MIGRRTLLSAAGGGVVASVLAGCRHDGGGQSTSPPASPTAPPSSTESTVARFPGDPGPGRIYLGISLAIDEPADARSELGGAITTSRRFYRAHQIELMSQVVPGDVAAGIVPFVSFKTPGSWDQVAAGRHDDWLSQLLTTLGGQRAPVFLALHHEPENDHTGGGNTPSAYVGMQQHAADLARASAPNVTVVPVLMQWTFDPASGRDPSSWMVPGVPLLGVDFYNPWTPGGQAAWLEFSTMLEQVRGVVARQPLVVPELGCRVDPADPSRAALWLRAAFDAALDDEVVGLTWFDSEHNNVGGRLRLDDAGLATMRQLLARPAVVRFTDL